jgi:voltage-gated potassium channel
VGHRFDMVITALIVMSAIAIVLETVSVFGEYFSYLFNFLAWFFTIIFTIEYFLRIYASTNRWKYITSFFGVIDFLAIAPMYIGIFYPHQQLWLIIRILRLLRIFRVFEMGHFVSEGALVANALKASKNKIIVFISFVGISTILMGALMYSVENQ